MLDDYKGFRAKAIETNSEQDLATHYPDLQKQFGVIATVKSSGCNNTSYALFFLQ